MWSLPCLRSLSSSLMYNFRVPRRSLWARLYRYETKHYKTKLLIYIYIYTDEGFRSTAENLDSRKVVRAWASRKTKSRIPTKADRGLLWLQDQPGPWVSGVLHWLPKPNPLLLYIVYRLLQLYNMSLICNSNEIYGQISCNMQIAVEVSPLVSHILDAVQRLQK